MMATSDERKDKRKKQMEIDPQELQGNKCKLFQIGDRKAVLCMENGKLTIYELGA